MVFIRFRSHRIAQRLHARLQGAADIRRVTIRKLWFISNASTHLDNEKISQYDKYSLIFVIANLNEISQNELRSTSQPIVLCKKKAKVAHKANAYELLLTHLLCENIEL